MDCVLCQQPGAQVCDIHLTVPTKAPLCNRCRDRWLLLYDIHTSPVPVPSESGRSNPSELHTRVTPEHQPDSDAAATAA